MGLFVLETNFAIYGAYHSNPVNIMIHMLFVWPLFFTALMILYYVPMFLLPNLASFFTLIYAVFYVCLDKKAGSFAAILCILCWVGASAFAQNLGYSLTWKLTTFTPYTVFSSGSGVGLWDKVVLAAQLFGWTAQFLGHGVYEKRAPANLVKAILMEPFFVLLEALRLFFGYEPYLGFQAKVRDMMEYEIKAWQEKKKKSS